MSDCCNFLGIRSLNCPTNLWFSINLQHSTITLLSEHTKKQSCQLSIRCQWKVTFSNIFYIKNMHPQFADVAFHFENATSFYNQNFLIPRSAKFENCQLIVRKENLTIWQRIVSKGYSPLILEVWCFNVSSLQKVTLYNCFNIFSQMCTIWLSTHRPNQMFPKDWKQTLIPQNQWWLNG